MSLMTLMPLESSQKTAQRQRLQCHFETQEWVQELQCEVHFVPPLVVLSNGAWLCALRACRSGIPFWSPPASVIGIAIVK